MYYRYRCRGIDKRRDIRIRREYIERSDALIAIVTGRWWVNGLLYSYSVNDEVNYAHQLDKPIYLFIEKETLEVERLIIKAKRYWIFERTGEKVTIESNIESNFSEIMEQINRDVIQEIREKTSRNFKEALF